MKSVSSIILLLATVGCGSGPLTTEGPASVPDARKAAAASTRISAKSTAQRVILVSFDGLSADEVRVFGAPAFEALPAHATRVVPVEPTATSATHAAILTGAGPDRTGIVSNQFHRPGTPIGETARGLETEIDTDTIVDRARAAGKRVGSIIFPFVDGASPRRTPDWGLGWSKPVTPPRMVHLSAGDFRSEWMPPTWGARTERHRSFSPVMRASLDWSVPQRGREDVALVACDTTDDRNRNYDAFYVETRSGETPLGADRWFQVSSRYDDGVYANWSKVMSADPGLASVKIYWGAIQHNNGFPAEYRDMVDRELGPWPGEPDEYHARAALGGGDGIDPETFAEMVHRLSSYLTRVTVMSMERMPFDLLLAYQPVLDETDHQFHMVNERQLFATPETLAAAQRVRRAAYADFDAGVRAIRGAIDVTRDALVVTGDHGLGATDTEVRLNQVLPPNWHAYSNGNVTHVYRFGGEDNTDAAIRSLSELHAPDGEPVFEKVTRKPAGAHRNAGDVIGFAYPRFTLSNGSGDLFARSVTYGQHGGLSSHPEFHTTLGAAGSAVGVQRVETMDQTAVEPLLEALLGLSRHY